MTLKTVIGGLIQPGFMPSRIATEHGQWRRRKGRQGEACREEKSDHQKRATVKWGTVEVCGVGVPLPESNLVAAQESKVATTTLM